MSKGLHSLSRPDSGRSDIAVPSPYILLHHLFMTTQPFNHKSPSNAVEVALVVSPVIGNKSAGSKKEAQILCVVLYAVFSLLFLFPLSPASQVPFSTTVSPHRNPPEQLGESPCNHRLSTAHVLTITQIGIDTYPHTLTPPRTLHFISASISVLKWYSACHFTNTH